MQEKISSNEFIRLRCPFCGSMPYPSQLEEAQAKYPVAKVRIMLMRVGGKVKAEELPPGAYIKSGKGKSKGLISYEDVTDQHPELVKEFQDWFAARAVNFAQAGGYIKEDDNK